jgi:hypothetical protein
MKLQVDPMESSVYLKMDSALMICQIKAKTARQATTARLSSILNNLALLCTYSIDSMTTPWFQQSFIES